jgi:hypothetical protein
MKMNTVGLYNIFAAYSAYSLLCREIYDPLDFFPGQPAYFSHLRRGSWGLDPVIETNAQLLQLYNGREQFSISRKNKQIFASNVGFFVIKAFKTSLMHCQFHFFLNIWLWESPPPTPKKNVHRRLVFCLQ